MDKKDKFKIDYICEALCQLNTYSTLDSIFPIIENKNNLDIPLHIWESACKKKNISVKLYKLNRGIEILELI